MVYLLRKSRFLTAFMTLSKLDQTKTIKMARTVCCHGFLITIMAAGSAHVASTTQVQPSIFDLDAQNDLKELLKPIIRNVVHWLNVKYPGFSAAFSHPNTLSFIVSVVIESYYLKKFGATFSEAFYGLRRVENNGQDFTNCSVTKSLATEEVLPFLLTGLNNVSDNLVFDSSSGRNKDLVNAVIKLNKTVQIAFQLASFAQRLRYITGQTEYHSPLVWLSGLKIAYAEPVEESFSWRNFLPTAVQRSFEVGVFFLQCYHWWQTESHGILGSLPSPPAPETHHSANDYHGLCPLCLEPRRIETVLSVSGYVFCFACIQQYVTKYRKCPVTHLPGTVHDLIRIYPDDG